METNLIHPYLTVNEVIGRVPETVAVFKRFGIDACCGGALTVSDAARRHGAELDVLLQALRAAPVPA
jgi:iron-sulfur cluster repair protein YtfE (RIC family)